MAARQKSFQIVLFSLLVVFQSFAGQESIEELRGPYLGQRCPQDQAEVFLDGIICRIEEPEMCAAFSKDGREFYFNRMLDGHWTIFCSMEFKGRWTSPQPVNFSLGYTDRDFTLSPDGQRIYFGSNRPRSRGESAQSSPDIWVSQKIRPGEWGMPRNLGSPINTEASENYPSQALNGNLYFFSNRGEGPGGCEIYVSSFEKGVFQAPEVLGAAINSPQHDWDAFIAPDESFIIFSSQSRADTLGKQDLYISFQGPEDDWLPAINMGGKVNSSDDEICPSISLDGKYFFFTSRRRGKADIFWLDAKIIDELKRDHQRNFD